MPRVGPGRHARRLGSLAGQPEHDPGPPQAFPATPGAQPLHRGGHVGGGHREPVREVPAVRLQGQRHVVQVQFLVQVPGEPVGRLPQRLRGAGGHREDCLSPVHFGRTGLLGWRRDVFLQHHVGVGATEAERADARPAHPAVVPRPACRVDGDGVDPSSSSGRACFNPASGGICPKCSDSAAVISPVTPAAASR